jgi:hypothetical protein
MTTSEAVCFDTMMDLPTLYFPIDEGSGPMLPKSSTVAALQMGAELLVAGAMVRR